MGKKHRLVSVVVVGIALSALLDQRPAQAGILRNAAGICVDLLTQFSVRGREGITLLQLARHGLDRELMAKKFYGPQLSSLLSLIESEAAHVALHLHWSSTQDIAQLRSEWESLGIQVQTLNRDDRESQKGSAIVFAPLTLGLKRLLQSSSVRRMELVMDTPDQTVFENLENIPTEVLNKLSTGLLDRVLVSALHFGTPRFFDREVVLEYAGKASSISVLGPLLYASQGKPAAFVFLRTETLPNGGEKIYVQISPEMLLTLLGKSEFTHAAFAVP